jgi:hypothetical protein
MLKYRRRGAGSVRTISEQKCWLYMAMPVNGAGNPVCPSSNFTILREVAEKEDTSITPQNFEEQVQYSSEASLNGLRIAANSLRTLNFSVRIVIRWLVIWAGEARCRHH